MLTDPTALFTSVDTTIVVDPASSGLGKDIVLASVISSSQVTNSYLDACQTDSCRVNYLIDDEYDGLTYADDVPGFIDFAATVGYFDQIQTAAVPEPLTAWFFAFGGFLLSRRRIRARCRRYQ